MTKTYSASYARSIVDGVTGYDYYANRDMADARSRQALVGSASSMATLSIHCVLAGYERKAVAILQKAEKWIQAAIVEREQSSAYPADFYEAMKAEIAAMIHWLAHAREDMTTALQEGNVSVVERVPSVPPLGFKAGGSAVSHRYPDIAFLKSYNLQTAADYHDRYQEQMKQETGKADREAAALTLPIFLDARAYPYVFKWLSYLPRWTPPRPNSSKKRNTELDCSYIIAAHRHRHEFEASEVHRALEALFRRHFNEWMLAGHGINVVRWLKIAYWNDVASPPSPFEIVLRCYDYLPSSS